jgi:hypothetical protein
MIALYAAADRVPGAGSTPSEPLRHSISFVLVVQSFLKIPMRHALAPTGSEPAFTLTQGTVLLFYLVSGFLAVKAFRPALHQARLGRRLDQTG